MAMSPILWVIGIASVTATLLAQTPANPVFEVASVKPNVAAGRFGITFTPGRFTAVNAPLERLIHTAYGMPPFRVVDGPTWISTERFDVVAKATDSAPPASRAQMLEMLRALLVDRFALRTHRESRELTKLPGAAARHPITVARVALHCHSGTGRPAFGITAGGS